MNKGVLKNLNSKSLVEDIIDNFTNAIIAGEFKPGDKIPSEAELCEAMQVGRSSLREAIKILVAYGILYIRRGDGTYVQDNYSEKMLYPIIYGIILQKNYAKKLTDVRLVIDVGVLQMFMDILTDELMSQVEKRFDNLREALAKPGCTAEEVFDADIVFHNYFVEATHNEILVLLCDYMDKMTQVSRIDTTRKIIANNQLDDMLHKHEEIVDVLRRRDRDNISKVMKSHYQFWKAQME